MSVVYQKVSGTYNEFSYMVKKKKKKEMRHNVSKYLHAWHI